MHERARVVHRSDYSQYDCNDGWANAAIPGRESYRREKEYIDDTIPRNWIQCRAHEKSGYHRNDCQERTQEGTPGYSIGKSRSRKRMNPHGVQPHLLVRHDESDEEAGTKTL